MQYAFVIKHKPGILNWADALFRCPDMKPTHDHQEEIGLPNHMFINTTSALNLDHAIIAAQNNHSQELLMIKQCHPITYHNNHWELNQRLVVAGNNKSLVEF